MHKPLLELSADMRRSLLCMYVMINANTCCPILAVKPPHTSTVAPKQQQNYEQEQCPFALPPICANFKYYTAGNLSTLDFLSHHKRTFPQLPCVNVLLVKVSDPACVELLIGLLLPMRVTPGG